MRLWLWAKRWLLAVESIPEEEPALGNWRTGNLALELWVMDTHMLLLGLWTISTSREGIPLHSSHHGDQSAI